LKTEQPTTSIGLELQCNVTIMTSRRSYGLINPKIIAQSD